MSLDNDHAASQGRAPRIWFQRAEFDIIMSLYGRGLLAGLWRDYAIDDGPDAVVFSIYRRASETPLYRIEKRPSQHTRQGTWSVAAAAGQVLRRGHDVRAVLDVLERKLLKVVK